MKEENLKLKSENTVLGQYIENLMQVEYTLHCTLVHRGPYGGEVHSGRVHRTMYTNA